MQYILTNKQGDRKCLYLARFIYIPKVLKEDIEDEKLSLSVQPCSEEQVGTHPLFIVDPNA